MVTKIERLMFMDKTRKQQAISLLLEYKREIIGELESINNAIQAMSNGESINSTEKPTLETPEDNNSDNIWLTMTVQEAVIRFLKLHPNKPFRASEIGKYIKKQKVPGWDKKSFASMIATSVRRLAEKGKAVQTTVRIKDREVAAFQYEKTDN